tara:strand:- start:111 stop:584 length:474 start_codon:yes stop_codon:yes gene_type:complete
MPKVDENFEHEFEVSAQPEEVWAFLWDIEAMANCIPGCEEVSTLEEKKSYKVQMRRKVGPFLVRMEIDLVVVESEYGRLIIVESTGRDKKLRSELRQRVRISLSPKDGSGSHVGIQTRFQLSGVLATLGWTLLSGHIYAELNQFVEVVKNKIEERQT